MSKLSICFKIMELKFPNANLVDISPENKGWYKYKDEKKSILIKYSDNREKPSWSFNNINKLSEDIEKLILAFTKNNKLSYIEINPPFINDEENGYIQYNRNKIIYYPKKIHKIPDTECNDNSTDLITDNIDISLTIERYKNLMNRNYRNIFNYLLFSLYETNNKNATLDVKNIELLEKCWASECQKYTLGSIGKESIQNFKKIYTKMEDVRNRNTFFNYFIDNEKTHTDEDMKRFIEKVKKYETEYNRNYQKNIMPFNSFTKIWDIKERACAYCGVNETQIKELIDNNKIKTKRVYSRGKTMEIDKKEADGEYETKNIVLSCYWCNNAKTDEFDIDDFEEIAKGINKVWSKRLGKSIVFPEEIYNLIL